MGRAVRLLASIATAVLFASVVMGLTVIGSVRSAAVAAVRPNIVLILTNDLDTYSMSKLPGLREASAEHGMIFRNYFVTTSLCSPSRASILRGQYSHNTGITGNNSPNGGAQVFRERGLDKNTIATRLRRSGYEAAFFGNYMNDYHETPRYVPPGWTTWHAFSGATDVNHNGTIEEDACRTRCSTDYLRHRTSEYIRNNNFQARPLFLEINTRDPHAPAEPPARYEDAFKDEPLIRKPNFNEKDVSDKPVWIRNEPRLTDAQKRKMAQYNRDRLRTMLAVEDLYRQVVKSLREKHQLDNTYIFFTSDNGYHLGAHRLKPGKWTAYEEDTRVPFIVRGPGIKPGTSSYNIALNNDLAPTLSDIANASNPSFVDGRSLLPVLRRTGDNDRTAYLQEDRAAFKTRRPALQGVRTPRYSYVKYATGEKELYDLSDDPYQLRNRNKTTSPNLVATLEGRLESLASCVGEACYAAENQ